MEGYQQLPISRNATHRKLYSFKIQCTERDRAWVDFLNSMALIRQARWHKWHQDFSHSETTVGGILKFKHESLPSYFSPPLQTIDPYPPTGKTAFSTMPPLNSYKATKPAIINSAPI